MVSTDAILAERPPLVEVEVDDALAALLAAHPLPDGVDDADLNQELLAASFNTTVNTVSKWIKEGMPVAQHGTNGRPYILRLSHCYAWRAARDAEQDRRDRHNRAQVDAMQASFLGLHNEDPRATLSAAERKALAEADIAHSRASHMRRQLVPLRETVELLESICKIIRDGVEDLPDRLERELGLKPEQVRAVRRAGADVLTKMEQRIAEAELEGRDVPAVAVEDRWVI